MMRLLSNPKFFSANLLKIFIQTNDMCDEVCYFKVWGIAKTVVAQGVINEGKGEHFRPTSFENTHLLAN